MSGSDPTARRTRAKTIGILAAVLVAAIAAAGIGHATTVRPHAPAAATTVTTGAATVSRGTVRQRVQLPGVTGYAGSFAVIAQASGVLTRTARPGAVVTRGQKVYAVADRPVRLLYGATPAYRSFESGMADGRDVRELERNLVALGAVPRRDISVDDHFDASTAAAIRRWQARSGVPAAARTGTLPLGSVVFLPGALRVAQVQLSVGATVDANVTVLTGTSTHRVVVAQLGTDQQGTVHRHDRVEVTLPDGRTAAGRVTSVGAVAEGAAPSPGSTGQGPSPSGVATQAVTVDLRLPVNAHAFDQAPVQVAITTAEHTGVLLVPVTALLARPGGGYQVHVLSGRHRYAPVTPGLFDDVTGTVEVSGAGLTADERVEVPAQ